MGYSPWGHKELDMTEQLSTAHIVTYGTAAILQLEQKIKYSRLTWQTKEIKNYIYQLRTKLSKAQSRKQN